MLFTYSCSVIAFTTAAILVERSCLLTRRQRGHLLITVYLNLSFFLQPLRSRRIKNHQIQRWAARVTSPFVRQLECTFFAHLLPHRYVWLPFSFFLVLAFPFWIFFALLQVFFGWVKYGRALQANTRAGCAYPFLFSFLFIFFFRHSPFPIRHQVITVWQNLILIFTDM